MFRTNAGALEGAEAVSGMIWLLGFGLVVHLLRGEIEGGLTGCPRAEEPPGLPEGPLLIPWLALRPPEVALRLGHREVGGNEGAVQLRGLGRQ